jgi:hypothetical protein
MTSPIIHHLSPLICSITRFLAQSADFMSLPPGRQGENEKVLGSGAVTSIYLQVIASYKGTVSDAKDFSVVMQAARTA